MDSHFHGNDRSGGGNDRGEIEIATGSTQVILSTPLAMTFNRFPLQLILTKVGIEMM